MSFPGSLIKDLDFLRRIRFDDVHIQWLILESKVHKKLFLKI